MTIRLDLNELVQIHAKGCRQADGYQTSTHSGVAAVLKAVLHQAKICQQYDPTSGPLRGLVEELELASWSDLPSPARR